MATPTLALTDALGGLLGARLVTDPDALCAYARDVTGAHEGRPVAAALPQDTAEVAQILRAARDAGVGVVVQGGHTSLSGGATPVDGELVLSTRRLTGITRVAGGLVAAGAGTTLAALQAWLGEDEQFGVDMGSRDAATLGGMAAANGGGQWALRHGVMRDQVAGLEAVLPDGGVIDRMRGLAKDTAGLDLAHLLVGSEGTLAVLTRLLLRTGPRPAASATVLVGLATTQAAVDLVADLRATLDLRSAELFFDDGLELVLRHARLVAPFASRPPVLLLAEPVGPDLDADALLDRTAQVLERHPGILASTGAADAAGQRRLWALREGHNPAVGAAGVPLKLDLAVRPDAVATFHAALLGALGAAGLPRPVVWGHLGDGNLHVNLLGLDEDGRARAEELVLALAAAHGGTISAEHGLGRAKIGHLGLVREPADVALQGRLKEAFDPGGLLGRR